VPLGVTAHVTLTVTDQAGNPSAARTFGFEAAAADPAVLALDGPPDEWVLRFDRDFESATHTFGTWTTGPTNPGTKDTVAPDGRVDFNHDIEGLGLASAGGAGLVDGSATLTMNQAARNWVVNRVLYHLAPAYGQSVDFDDGSPNPGFAAIRAPVPRAGAGGAKMRFSFAEVDPGTGVNQLGFGGLTANTTVLGRADFDGQNDDRSHDDGATSANVRPRRADPLPRARAGAPLDEPLADRLTDLLRGGRSDGGTSTRRGRDRRRRRRTGSRAASTAGRVVRRA
jgi:hypothetical protein